MSDLYRVLIYSPGQDTAGIGARSREMLLSFVDGLDVVAVRRTDTYLHFPTHLTWPGDEAFAVMVRRADLIHVHNHVRLPMLTEAMKAKPTIVHHHGTIFREQETADLLAGAAEVGAITAVSTLDLTTIAPELVWLPSPIQVDWMASLRAKYYQPSERIRIVHAPTNRAVKDTDLFIAVIHEMREAGEPVEGMVIEGQPWSECLKMKAAHADIFYDQLQLGYGQNALEAWAMGVPVVAGAHPEIERTISRRIGFLPYHRATPETLRRVLTHLVRSESARRTCAATGHAYVRLWHDYPRVAELTVDAYDDAARRKGQTFPGRVRSAAWLAARSAEPTPSSTPAGAR